MRKINRDRQVSVSFQSYAESVFERETLDGKFDVFGAKEVFRRFS